MSPENNFGRKKNFKKYCWKIAENEAELGVNFKIVETGGLSMRSILQKSNPLKDKGCENQDCLPCKDGRGAGGDCKEGSVNYEL